jgi:hypothetical protein
MLIHYSEQSEESPACPLPRRERSKVRVVKMRIPEKFGQKNSAKILDRAGGRYGTLRFWKSRTVTSDLPANADEISGKNLENLDKWVGGWYTDK